MGRETQSPYEILGVSKDASSKEIRLAFGRLMMQCHPDHNQDDKAANEKAQKLLAAYNALTGKKGKKKIVVGAFNASADDDDAGTRGLRFRGDTIPQWINRIPPVLLDAKNIQELTDYAIQAHYPTARQQVYTLMVKILTRRPDLVPLMTKCAVYEYYKETKSVLFEALIATAPQVFTEVDVRRLSGYAGIARGAAARDRCAAAAARVSAAMKVTAPLRLDNKP